MKFQSVFAFAHVALAARPFLNEPDTGLESVFGNISPGSFPPLASIAGLPDFEWAARNVLPLENYTYYRNGAGGEWSYRNNLEVFSRYTLKPKRMVEVTKIEDSMRTSVLGFNFSAPFFISPAARGGYGHPEAERNLVKAAANEDILYMPSLKATLSIKEIAAAKKPGQVTFQQLYLPSNWNRTAGIIKNIEKSGAAAIVLTIDAPANGRRQRAFRQRGSVPPAKYQHMTWDTYHQLKKMTSLPIVLKGIMTVEDAQEAAKQGVLAIMISNHGARQLDGVASSLEVAMDIHKEDPELFKRMEIYADGGIRYGTDVLKLLALGVKAVGLARPFMFANVFGVEGVEHAIRILKDEVAVDAANLGVTDLKKVDTSFMDLTPNGWGS